MTAKYTKRLQNIPNGLKLYQLVTKYTNICRYSVARPSKHHPNWDFGFENETSGNPANYRQGDQMSF
jgi:hypothetical protein